MAICKACGRDVIAAIVHGTETVLLDPHYNTWVSVEEHHFFPADGDRVFQSSALVEHAAVCQGQRQAQQRDREAGKKTYQQQHKSAGRT